MEKHSIAFDNDVPEEPKDRTKWWWLVVLVLLAAAVAGLWMINNRRGDITEVRAKHILIKCNKDDPVDRARALELITSLRKDIEAGKSFAAVAREYSNDEYSAARGGDLGYYSRGKFEEAFEQYVWTAPLGQLSDIVQTKFGFHLIVVLDRHISAADQYEMELEKKAREATSPPPAAP